QRGLAEIHGRGRRPEAAVPKKWRAEMPTQKGQPNSSVVHVVSERCASSLLIERFERGNIGRQIVLGSAELRRGGYREQRLPAGTKDRHRRLFLILHSLH